MMTLAVVLLTLAVVPAMATSDKGNSTQEVTAPHVVLTAAVKSRHLTSASSGYRSGLKAWRFWHRKLRSYQRETWHRQSLMQVPHTRFSRRLASSGLASLKQYVHYWKQVAARNLYRFRHPPHLSDWMCIHHYEGAWNDSGGPYWGGLQMDLSFQSTYGGWLLRHKGTADHWTPMEQIWVAVRASQTRGFSPWPNTAYYCGLL